MSIYREQLMEYYRDPSNRGSISSPTVSVDVRNPMCGDEIKLDLEISDGKVNDFKFDGEACAVCIASCSITSEEVIGRSINEAKKFGKEELLDLLGVNLTTSRVKCATLILDALEKAVNKYEKE